MSGNLFRLFVIRLTLFWGKQCYKLSKRRIPSGGLALLNPVERFSKQRRYCLDSMKQSKQNRWAREEANTTFLLFWPCLN